MSLNKNNYANSTEFLEVIKKALSKNATALSKKIFNGTNNEKIYKQLLDDYFYYLTLTEDIIYADTAPITHVIVIEEVGGNGSYYLNYGNLRKRYNKVVLSILPPYGLDVDTLTINEEESNSYYYVDTTNIYQFDMPDEDVNIMINYSANITKVSIYYGLSNSLSPNFSDNTELIVKNKSPFIFTVPFENIGTPYYIWFGSPIRINLMKNTIGDEYDLTTEFTETTGTINGNPYYFYVHKWKTEIRNLTFKTS